MDPALFIASSVENFDMYNGVRYREKRKIPSSSKFGLFLLILPTNLSNNFAKCYPYRYIDLNFCRNSLNICCPKKL